MWAYQSVFYQIYPLGFCGAPKQNDEILCHRISKIADFAEHIEKLGCNAVYLSPIFDSDSHGYDTRDFRKIDPRLGTTEDFSLVCKTLHQHNIRIVLDAVFNHVGRGFWAFQDVLTNRQSSAYADWFHINWDGNSNYNDGFWYEGWEGHFELVKLNLRNPSVVSHLLECVAQWISAFDIDGLRLDVAYCLNHDFVKQLRAFCDSKKADFFLIGELLHGDYNQFVNNEMLHSCTNYECYKGLFSSFNSYNLFEITHSLLRQFGPENWTIYRGKHLLSFVDNHDVSRIASQLENPNHLPLIYGLLCAMPGIPCIYYGSEWGQKGNKSDGDDALRPSFDLPQWNELTNTISQMIAAHKQSHALCFGDFKQIVLTNKQCIWLRQTEKERIYVAANIDAAPYTAYFDANASKFTDLLSGKKFNAAGSLELAPYAVYYLKAD